LQVRPPSTALQVTGRSLLRVRNAFPRQLHHFLRFTRDPATVETTIFLTVDDFVTVNRVYEAFFGAYRPARSTVAVAPLPLVVRVDIEAIAGREGPIDLI
jgi:hypothetical protein